MAERSNISPALRAEVAPALNNRAAFEFNPDTLAVAPAPPGVAPSPGGTGTGGGATPAAPTPQPRVRVQPGDLITADLINFILARLDALESIKQPEKSAAADKPASADKTFEKSAAADKGIEKINIEKSAVADKAAASEKGIDKIAAEKAATADKAAAAEKGGDKVAAEKAAEKGGDKVAAEKAAEKGGDKVAAEKAAEKGGDKVSAEKAAEKGFDKAVALEKQLDAGGIASNQLSGTTGIARPQKGLPGHEEDAVDPATGHAFIRPEERPHVEKKAVDRASETEEPEEPAAPGPKPRRKKPSARRPR